MSRFIVSCVVDPGPAHDRVRVWVRGQSVGALTVGAGDGEALAQRLCGLPEPASAPERIENEGGSVWFCETPDLASAPRRIRRDEAGAVLCPDCGDACCCECSHVREPFDVEAYRAKRGGT
jgi:hypothetical protein